MGNLSRSIIAGELATPAEFNAVEFFKNIDTKSLEELVATGSTVVSDGRGQSFVIEIPLSVLATRMLKAEDIRITKIPYSNASF